MPASVLAAVLATAGSYGIALRAMTLAPIAVVAALRETSIVFAAAIAAWVLREQVGPARIAGAVLIAAVRRCRDWRERSVKQNPQGKARRRRQYFSTARRRNAAMRGIV